jgi:hypothetical protein
MIELPVIATTGNNLVEHDAHTQAARLAVAAHCYMRSRT